jgi:hypothetical protein
MFTGQPFAVPEHFEPVPGLADRVEAMYRAGRYRTAMDEILGLLRRDPANAEAMILAATIVYVSRTTTLRAAEPLTRDQSASAILAPVAVQCSRCTAFWYALGTVLPIPNMIVVNPLGVQCPVCRYTLCKDCAAAAQHRGAAIPCPAPGCSGTLEPALRPTGRREVLPIDPSEIERVIVTRDGPIPPTILEALPAVTRYVPLVPDDAPFVIICRGGPSQMSNANAPSLARGLVDGLEQDMLLAPGAWDRSTSMRVTGAEDDSDYLVIIVKLPERQSPSAFLTGLMADHLQRIADAKFEHHGPCWAGLYSGDVSGESAALLQAAASDARQANRLATRTRILPGYVIVATGVPTLDLQAARRQFAPSYVAYLEQLNGSFRLPGYGLNFVHWIACADGATTQLHLTFLPADSAEQPLLAQDLVEPDMRRVLGL